MGAKTHSYMESIQKKLMLCCNWKLRMIIILITCTGLLQCDKVTPTVRRGRMHVIWFWLAIQPYMTCLVEISWQIYMVQIHTSTAWMTDCIMGRPKPALDPWPSMIYCSSPSISTPQQSYTSNEVQYLTYRGVLVVTQPHEVMAPVAKS